MGACLSGPKGCGLEDAGKPGATTIQVTFSTGKEVPVTVLPSDTMRDINRKVEVVHGVQPPVVIKKKSQHPELQVRHERKWVPVSWDAKFSELPEGARDKLKYSDITDILKKVKLARHAHWVASHVVQ